MYLFSFWFIHLIYIFSVILGALAIPNAVQIAWGFQIQQEGELEEARNGEELQFPKPGSTSKALFVRQFFRAEY